jgi:hypothetical protein
MKSPAPFLLAACFLICGCEKAAVQTGKRQLSREEISSQEISTLRRELHGKNGADAFMDLQRYGDAGFETAKQAMVRGEITPAMYDAWVSSVRDKWEDGGKIISTFEQRLFKEAAGNPAFTADIAAGFFSKYPEERLRRLEVDERPGVREVAAAALFKKSGGETPPTKHLDQ